MQSQDARPAPVTSRARPRPIPVLGRGMGGGEVVTMAVMTGGPPQSCWPWGCAVSPSVLLSLPNPTPSDLLPCSPPAAAGAPTPGGVGRPVDEEAGLRLEAGWGSVAAEVRVLQGERRLLPTRPGTPSCSSSLPLSLPPNRGWASSLLTLGSGPGYS